MLVRREDRKKVLLTKGSKNRTIVWDYPMPSEEIGISVQNIEGRVPESGSFRNRECHEVLYIISGTGNIVVEGMKYTVKGGDVIVIPKGKRSYITSRKLKILAATSPDWRESQCEVAD